MAGVLNGVWVRIVAVALAAVVSLAGQDQRFEVQSRLVLVPATVTDRKGRIVEGLEAADFVLLDNRKRQRVAVDTFGRGIAPIAMVVAVQSSGISVAALDKVRKIGSMIQPLITGKRGCAALLTFDETVEWRQDCTSDADELALAFTRLRPGVGKSARMLDGAYEAIERLRERVNVRRVLLLISESRDRGSDIAMEAVVVAAQTAGVTVYSMTFSAFATAFTTTSAGRERRRDGPTLPASRSPENPPGREELPTTRGKVQVPPREQRVDMLGGLGELVRLGKKKATKVLAEATGGAAAGFGRQKGLERAVERLGAELHSQYLLSFVPEDPELGYHKLEVKVPGRDRVRVRARIGYWVVE